jgi:peptide/nickel transport system permease protein
MYTFIGRRLLSTIPVLLIVAVLVFLMLRLTPGDPAAILAGDAASSEQIAAIRASLGLDRSILVQFGIWASNLLQGDFGSSYFYKMQVTQLIGQRIEPTLALATLTILIAVVVSVPLGVIAAWRFGGWFDRALMGFSVLGFSVPVFVLAYILIWIVSLKLGWFPVQGWGDSFIENLFVYSSLPILIGLVVSIAPDLRLYRTFVLDEINQDYVRTARAKGVSENRIMWIHVLRNASIPIITFLMAGIPALLLGSFLIERFFSIPGIGREVILAVERSDFPVIKAITVYVALATIATNLLADLTYKAVDPRVQLK